MTDLTNYNIAQVYEDYLTLNNSNAPGTGLTDVLVSVQDGLGNSSPMQISTDAVNFLTEGGNTLQINGVAFTGTAGGLNNLTGIIPNFTQDTALVIPAGNTAERPNTVDGAIRYNTELNVFEGTSQEEWEEFLTATQEQVENILALAEDPPTFLQSSALWIPIGDTSERPSVGEVGYFRYNTDTNEFEGYTNLGWKTFTVS
jgi:hypothetical protein